MDNQLSNVAMSSSTRKMHFCHKLTFCPEDCQIGPRYKCALIGSSAEAVIGKLQAAKFALELKNENDGNPFADEAELPSGSGRGSVKLQSQERCDRAYVQIQAGLLASVELLAVKAFQDELPDIGSMDECNTRMYLFVLDPRKGFGQQAQDAKFRVSEMVSIAHRAGFKALHATVFLHAPEETGTAGRVREDFAHLLTEIANRSRHDDVRLEANFDDPDSLYAAFTRAVRSTYWVNRANPPVPLAQASPPEASRRPSCCTMS